MSQIETTQPTGGAAGDQAAAGGTTGATGQQGEKTFTQAEANAFAAEAKRRADSELAKAQARLEELSAKLMTADEKKIADAVKAREAELQAAHAAELRGRDVRLALAGKGIRQDDLEMVAALVPNDLTTPEQIKAKVEEIIKARPYLLDSATPGFPPGGPPPTGNPNHYTAERIRELRDSGEWPKHEPIVQAALRAGRIVS